MSHRRIHLPGDIAIPAGHRVQVTWYGERRVVTALFGKDTVEVVPLKTPIVTDLDTSVRYTTGIHYDFVGVVRGEINLSAHDLNPALEVREEATGTVIRCSIVRFTDHSETELDIDLGVESDEPYRSEP
ncbi:MAG: hypothetical protein AAF721_14255 [Myxococcota bacterium]